MHRKGEKQMTPRDDTFFEEYKRFDRICSDMYSVPGGVSQYILDMENHFSEGTLLVDNWKQTYGEIKHLRWVRNQIAHEASGGSISSDHDLVILQAITLSILQQEDPLALLHREQYRRCNRITQRRQKHEKKLPVEAVDKTVLLSRKRRKTCFWQGVILLILFILSTAVIVFAIYLSIE